MCVAGGGEGFLMSKLVLLDKTYWPQGGYGHWCPGCGYGHEINVDSPNASGAKWAYDGNASAPTFSPSINMRWGKFAGQKETDDGGICHYFIRGGMIQYCGDTTHSLSGQTVALPDIPDGKYFTSQRL